jgi:hypothetical protein
MAAYISTGTASQSRRRHISATARRMMTGIMVGPLIVPRHRQRRFLSPCMQHINNACAEYEMALGAIAAYTSTADKPAV